MKICSKCKVELEISEFNKNAAAPDGLYPRCKKCLSIYRQQNKEHTSKYKREYYLNNRESIMAKRTPEKVVLYRATRRAKTKSNGTYLVSEKELHKLKNSKCTYCGSGTNIEIDHIIPISRGGTHGVGNLTAACMKCNRSKSNKLITEWKKYSI